MTKITDRFKVGDKVAWTIEREMTGSYPDRRTYAGVIEKIIKDEAMVKPAFHKRCKRVPLTKLRMII